MKQTLIGALLVVLGAIGYFYFTGDAPSASGDGKAACITEIKKRAGDDKAAYDQLVATCDTAAGVAAITATDAQSAAQAISQANRTEVGSNGVKYFSLGLGIVGLLLLVLGLKKKS